MQVKFTANETVLQTLYLQWLLDDFYAQTFILSSLPSQNFKKLAKWKWGTYLDLGSQICSFDGLGKLLDCYTELQFSHL